MAGADDILKGAVGSLPVIGDGLTAYWNNEELGAIEAKKRKELEKVIKKIEEQWELPEYDQTPLTPEEYKLVGTYVPELASYIQEKSPSMVQEKGSVDARQKQQQALDRMNQLSTTGEDAQARAQREKEIAFAEGERRRNLEKSLKSFQERGIGGGGQELLGSMAAGQSADEARRQTSLDVAAQNEARRNQALMNMSNMAGNIRTQNLNVEQANVSAINAFNERNSRNKNAYEQYVAQQNNAAQAANLNAAQNTANSNTGLRNSYGQYNQEKYNSNQDKIAGAKNAKLQAEMAARGMVTDHNYNSGIAEQGRVATLRKGVGDGIQQAGQIVGDAYTGGAYSAATGGSGGGSFSGDKAFASIKDMYSKKNGGK